MSGGLRVPVRVSPRFFVGHARVGDEPRKQHLLACAATGAKGHIAIPGEALIADRFGMHLQLEPRSLTVQ